MGSISGNSFNPFQNGTQSTTSTGSNQSGVFGSNQYSPQVTGATNKAIGMATQVANQAFSAPTADQAVAPLSSNQTAAYAAANAGAGLIGQNNRTLGQSWTDPRVQRNYSDPYINGVLNAQNAMAAQQYGGEQSNLRNTEGMTGAFGGDRGAVQEAQLANNYNLSSDLRNKTGLESAYNSGMSQFNTDRTNALNSNAQEYGALQSTGAAEQAVGQAKDSYNVARAQAQRDWEKNQLGTLVATLQGVPKNSTSTQQMNINQKGQTVNSSTNSGMSNLGSIASMLGLLGGSNGLLSGAGSALGKLFGGGNSGLGGGSGNFSNNTDQSAFGYGTGNNGSTSWDPSSGNGGNDLFGNGGGYSTGGGDGSIGNYTDPSQYPSTDWNA